MGKLTRALLSVSDKTGLAELGQYLHSTGVEIISTGGTAKALRDAGIPVKDVSEHTGFPEMMDGRLKTLHPKVHGGLLGRRNNPGDLEEMRRHGIEEIDMVVVNLYPFEQTVARADVAFDDAIENIDIGGPTMLRAAAKNFRDVAVVVDPRDYAGIIEELRNHGGKLSYKTHYRLSQKVFEHTSRYDTLIAQYLRDASEEEQSFPDTLTLTFRAVADLPAGENRHQRARAYAEAKAPLSVFDARILQGEGASFRRYMDIHTAVMLLREFDEGACAIVKHATPCGMAVDGSAAEAFAKALRTDTVSALGGLIGFSAEVGGEAAELIMETLPEAVLAPSYTPEALAVFALRPGLNVIELAARARPLAGAEIIRVAGGVLVQDWDMGTMLDLRAFTPVTRRLPTDEEYAALEFAWKVCKHVRSDAVVYALRDRTLGIGGGQPSRVYAARVGAINAQESLRGSVVASDGLIPSVEAIEGVKKAGATAIVQPGGFGGDARIIAAADKYEMAMVFTGMEHFKY